MKNRIVLLVLFSLVLVASCAYASGGGTIPRTEMAAEGEEYSSLDQMLNESGQQGKEAGEVELRDDFDSTSGGMPEMIGDTVEAQNELEND